ARFVVCCSERAAAVVLSHRQNATLHRGRYKRGSCRRQERTCWETLIARPRAEPLVFPAKWNFARRFLAGRTEVPRQPLRTKSKPRQRRGRSLTPTNCCRAFL